MAVVLVEPEQEEAEEGMVTEIAAEGEKLEGCPVDVTRESTFTLMRLADISEMLPRLEVRMLRLVSVS